MNFCRQFIPNYTQVVTPLYAITKKRAFEWNATHEECFQRIKEAFRDARVLAQPVFNDESRPFVVMVDASDEGIGASLLQADETG